MFFNSPPVQRSIRLQCILKRHLSNKNCDMSKIRNIGVLAHIDAGKYLFYNFHIEFLELRKLLAM